MASREVEAKLRVCGGDPERVLREIGGRRELAGLALVDRGVRRQRDVYFDTPGGALRAQRAGLRLRRSPGDGEPWIVTLKLASEPASPAGLHARPEFERSWGADARDWLAERLAPLGVVLPRSEAPADPPPLVLRALGLVEIQQRETRRQRLEAGGPAPRAELALDRVCYELGGLRVYHREVEVEAVGSGERALVETLARALVREHPVEPFGCDKLALGLAFEVLHRGGELAPALDADGVPDAAVYRRAEALASRPPE